MRGDRFPNRQADEQAGRHNTDVNADVLDPRQPPQPGGSAREGPDGEARPTATGAVTSLETSAESTW